MLLFYVIRKRFAFSNLLTRWCCCTDYTIVSHDSCGFGGEE